MKRVGPFPAWVAPLAAFLAVVALHVVWTVLFPGQDPAQARWAGVDPTWAQRYFGTGEVFMGLSYGFPASFAVWAFGRWRGQRRGVAGAAAAGGATVAGVFAAAGCFLVGCCGSPMLVVWLNLLGVRFLPFAKPLMAVISACGTLAAWWWLNRRMLLSDDGCTCRDGDICERETGDHPGGTMRA